MTKFSGSIGGSRGSAGSDSTSIGQSQATGGPAGGYNVGKGWGAQGAPAPQAGASRPQPTFQPSSRGGK